MGLKKHAPTLGIGVRLCRSGFNISTLLKNSGLIYHVSVNQHDSPTQTDNRNADVQGAKEPIAPELIALFRILVKAPPKKNGIE
jgi:hypothetical protein